MHREVVLTLDDMLVEDGGSRPSAAPETTHTAMGRFGNVMLVGGETDLALDAPRGEVVRFYLTNTANTRVFNVAAPRRADEARRWRQRALRAGGTRRRVLLAPSERAVVDVLFDEPGELALEHRTPERTYRLGRDHGEREPAAPSLAPAVRGPAPTPELAAERERIAPDSSQPDKTLAFVAEMDMGTPEGEVVYTCPMHPEVVSRSRAAARSAA